MNETLCNEWKTMNLRNCCLLFLVLTSGWWFAGCKREPPAIAALSPPAVTISQPI